jgi:hypothetical protein
VTLTTLGQHMPGAMVQVNQPNNMFVWASKSGSNLCMAVMNPANNGAHTGPVAFSRWPLNGSGSAVIHFLQQTPTNPLGTTGTVTVTNGIIGSMTFPDTSTTIFYP